MRCGAGHVPPTSRRRAGLTHWLSKPPTVAEVPENCVAGTTKAAGDNASGADTTCVGGVLCGYIADPTCGACMMQNCAVQYASYETLLLEGVAAVEACDSIGRGGSDLNYCLGNPMDGCSNFCNFDIN